MMKMMKMMKMMGLLVLSCVLSVSADGKFLYTHTDTQRENFLNFQNLFIYLTQSVSTQIFHFQNGNKI